MAKRQKKGRQIISRSERDKELLEKARIARIQEIQSEGSLEIVEPKEDFEHEVSNLPEGLILLYEQTRDAHPTSNEYKKEIIESEYTINEVYSAIELGIKAWKRDPGLKER